MAMRRFELDYASVRLHNPRIVYCSISGFGSAGGAALPGYDLVVQAMSGLMSLTGAADGPAYRIVGQRRLARLRELVGEPPPDVPAEAWPPNPPTRGR